MPARARALLYIIVLEGYMKKVCDVIFTAIIVIVVIFAFLIVGIRLFGLKPYVVTSGSMEPNYPVGSLVYVKKCEPDELKVNDTITYVIKSGTVVTHRIVEVIPDEDNPDVVRYKTKGDANDHPDGTPVHFNNILGKVTFSIPIIGFIAYFVQTPPGSYLLIVVLLLLVLLSFLPNIITMIMTDKTIAERTVKQSETAEIAEPEPEQSEEKNPDADEPEVLPSGDTACQEDGNEND